MSLQAVTPAPDPPDNAGEARDIIAGRVGPDQIREFLRVQAPDQIRRALHDVPGIPAEAAQFTLLRTRLKPRRKLVAFYTIGDERPLPIAVTWSDEAPMRVLIAPEDPTFPHLARLYDADHVARLVAAAGGRAADHTVTVTPLRYRPGQRHVLRIDDTDTSERWYGKTYRDDTGERAIGTALAFQAAFTAWGGPAGTAQPYGYVRSDNLVLWAGSAGRPLSHVIANSPDAAHAAGAALRVLHDSRRGPSVSQSSTGSSDVAMEGRATVRAVEHIELLRPGTGKRVRQLLAITVGSLMDLPDESGCTLHGDFKCDNILIGPGGLTLLDFDRATIGDPALDLGKFCADLQWWAARADVPVDGLVAAFAEGYRECPTLRWERAFHYGLLFQLRAAGRRVTLHDADWAERVDACTATAAARRGRR